MTTITSLPFGPTTVPVPGFGAMGLSFGFNNNFTLTEAEPILLRALELGCTFWDTAVIYGAGINEKLLGDFIRKYNCRDKIFLASKCGFNVFEADGKTPNRKFECTNEPEHILEYIDRTIEKLGFTPDLYYLHRISPATPLEKSIPVLASLRASGKCKYIGLSECSATTLRKAHSIAPIDALQAEYSLFETLHETNGLIAACRDLGIAFVAFSPLGKGWLTGNFPYKTPEEIPEGDFRRTLPKFQGDNFYANLRIVKALQELAEKKGVTAAQVALAWVAAQGMIAIPGTTKIGRLEENWASRNVALTEDDKKELRKLIEENKIFGERYSAFHAKLAGN